MESMIIEDVNQKDRKAFKLRCIASDYTMREAVLWFMRQVGQGKLMLPEKTHDN